MIQIAMRFTHESRSAVRIPVTMVVKLAFGRV
jgi:hypothetical protein